MLENIQELQLHRSSTSTPWGFRLQGGAGTSAPLSIQRVFAGGAADGQLNRGDVLVSVNGHDVSEAAHFVAEEIIKKSDLNLTLVLKRGSTGHGHQQSDISLDYPFEMRSNTGLEEYEHARNLREIKQKFSEPEYVPLRGKVQINARPGSTSYVPRRPRMFQNTVSHQQTPSTEFGWVPKPREIPDYQSRYRPHHVQQVLLNEDRYSTLPRENVRHEHYERPAWIGTLRSSGGPKPWEIQDGISLTGGRQEEPHKTHHYSAPIVSSTFQVEDAMRAVHHPKIQVAKFSNKGFMGLEQRAPEDAHSNQARVANLQYNTPFSLYSTENAAEAYRSQTRKFTGDNSSQLSRNTFDPAHSDVYRMVRDEDGRRVGHHQTRQPHRSHQIHRHHQPAADTHHGIPQRSARLEHLIHENDDQQLSYSDTQHQSYGNFREGAGISDF